MSGGAIESERFDKRGDFMHKDILEEDKTRLLLGLLEKEPLHGYQIMEKSNEKFWKQEGQLYVFLHVLERQGFLTSRIAENEEKQVRKHYRITKKGINFLSRLQRSSRGDL